MRRWLEFSPITFASKIKTPTLIMSDTGDVRVPITQSYQMFHALRDNGVETKFIAYPVTGHSPDDPVHAADVERRYAEWFESHLK
jgi:dipeptidyl aminopeptidase/acylaminoacyl peptidase